MTAGLCRVQVPVEQRLDYFPGQARNRTRGVVNWTRTFIKHFDGVSPCTWVRTVPTLVCFDTVPQINRSTQG